MNLYPLKGRKCVIAEVSLAGAQVEVDQSWNWESLARLFRKELRRNLREYGIEVPDEAIPEPNITITVHFTSIIQNPVLIPPEPGYYGLSGVPQVGVKSKIMADGKELPDAAVEDRPTGLRDAENYYPRLYGLNDALAKAAEKLASRINAALIEYYTGPEAPAPLAVQAPAPEVVGVGPLPLPGVLGDFQRLVTTWTQGLADRAERLAEEHLAGASDQKIIACFFGLILAVVLAVVILTGLGRTLQHSGSPGGARVAEPGAYRESGPPEAVAYKNRGLSAWKQKDYDRAVENFNRALELDPRNALVYYYRGGVYNWKHDWPRAIVDFTRALELGYKTGAAYRGRGNAYFSQGDFERALEDYNRSLELAPQVAPVRYYKAEALARTGHTDEALETFREFLSYAPQEESARIRKAEEWIKQLEGRKDQAGEGEGRYVSQPMAGVGGAQGGPRQAPPPGLEDGRASFTRGLAAYQKGDWGGALADLNRALELSPSDWQARYYQAAALDQAGRSGEALEAYKTFLRYCPPQARQEMIRAQERIRALER